MNWRMKERRKEGRKVRRKEGRCRANMLHFIYVLTMRGQRVGCLLEGTRTFCDPSVYHSFPSGATSRGQRVGCLLGRTRTFSTHCHRESGDCCMTPDHGRGRGRGRRRGKKRRRRRRERRQRRSETHHRHLASRGQVRFWLVRVWFEFCYSPLLTLTCWFFFFRRSVRRSVGWSVRHTRVEIMFKRRF